MPGPVKRIDPHPQYLNAARIWTQAEFAADAVVAGVTRSVALTLPIGGAMAKPKLGIEITEGTIYWEGAVPAAANLTNVTVQASLSYRNLEATTTLPSDDPANILYWKWKLSANNLGVHTQDHTTVRPESGGGKGIVAVSQRVFLNIRFSESIAAGWGVSATTVGFFMRVLFRFIRVSQDEVNSLLANATALQ